MALGDTHKRGVGGRRARVVKRRGSNGRTATGYRVRMAEVAKRVGVSAITVSRTLWRPEKVSPDTRQKVEKAIKELRYVFNMAAGTLASQRSRIVAVIVPNISNSVFAETLHGLSDVLREAGYQLLIGHSGYSLAEEQSLVSTFLARRPEGIVLTGFSHSRRTVHMIKAAGIPVVEMWNLTHKPIDTIVGFSNFEAARAMTHYLAQKGYRRFGYIGGLIENNDRTQQREAGFAAALKELGLPFDSSHRIRKPFEFDAGSVAMRELMERAPKIDVVFAAADILAVGALLECTRRGWNVPQRVAVAGFDDAPISSQMLPPLTTVRVPRYNIGVVSAQQLLAHIAGHSTGQKVLDLGFEIIKRESA